MATTPILSTPTIKPSKELGTVNLFRFIHYANPTNVVAHANARYNFIENLNLSASQIMPSESNSASRTAMRTAITTTTTTFNNIKSSRNIIEFNSALFDFGFNLKKFPKQLSLNDIGELTAEIVLLSESELSVIWDNLYYQAIKKKSNQITDATVQLLRSNAFISEFRTLTDGVDLDTLSATQKENMIDILERIAGANVIIPSVLVSKLKDVDANAPSVDSLDVTTKSKLINLNKADIAQYKINQYNQFLYELDKAEEKNNNDNAILYEQADALYKTAVSDIVDNFDSPTNTIINTVTGEEKNEIVTQPTLPQFDFTAQSLFRDDFMSTNLSSTSLLIYNKNKPSSRTKYIDYVSKIKNLITEQYNIMANNSGSEYAKVMVGDVMVEINDNINQESIIITAEKILGSEDLYTVFVTHNFVHKEYASDSIALEIADSTNTILSNTDLPIRKSDSHVTYQLFPEGISDINTEKNYNISLFSEINAQPVEISSSTTKLSKPIFFRIIGAANDELNTNTDTEPGSDSVPLYGIKRIGIMEYKRVEQKICCYTAGEVSHIENIMAREYKEKSARSLTRSEIVQEDSREKEVENLQDTTSTDRHELQSEISQVIQEEQSRQIGVNAGGSVNYKPVEKLSINVFANTNMNFTNSSATTNSYNASESFAKEVVERALQRVVEKVSSKRTSKMLREYEEINKHGFDNREGDKHVTGVYRWVDKIYENTLMNYGKRLLYDFMVPEPSKNYKKWMTNTSKVQQGVLPRKPKDPISFGIKETIGWIDGVYRTILPWENTNENNYALAAAEYGADIDPCPEYEIHIGKSFSDNPKNKVTNWDESMGSSNFEIEIPDGYVCNWYWGQYSHSISYNSRMKSEACLQIDTRSIWINRPGGWNFAFNEYFQNSNQYMRTSKKLAISVSTFNVGGFAINITAKCIRTKEVYQQWQKAAYLAIMEAYYKRLEEYNNAEATFNNQNTSKNADYNFNTYKGRSIEQRELKRACIEMMLKPFGKTIGKDNYGAESNGMYPINLSLGFDTHAKYVKFLEEAFQWDLMSYYFYPYYWGNQSDWEKLIKESGTADELFLGFLQSGMARVTVPVRPEFEYAVVYLLNTGDITHSNGLATDDNHDLYLSIADLLKINEGIPEATWHIRVPSDLVIIQNDSSALDEEGLPCEVKRDKDGKILLGIDGKPMYCENGEPIATGKSLLGKQTTSMSEGVGSWIVSADENQTPPIIEPPVEENS